MSHISLKSLLENKSPLIYKHSGRHAEGQQAWIWFKRWADNNRRNDFIYKVLDTIKSQNYMATSKQQEIIDKWFRS